VVAENSFVTLFSINSALARAGKQEVAVQNYNTNITINIITIMRISSSPGSRQGGPYDKVLQLSSVEPSWWARSKSDKHTSILAL